MFIPITTKHGIVMIKALAVVAISQAATADKETRVQVDGVEFAYSCKETPSEVLKRVMDMLKKYEPFVHAQD
jgi:hypothetical protein